MTTGIIERPRFLCALGGALSTLNALPGVVPIIHASSGCGGNIYQAYNGGAGYLGSGYCGGLALPSSNVYEEEIVFGGETRLAEQIANTLKVVDGELYFVVTGCMTEMIGDDARAVASRFRDQGLPVLVADTGGFRGNSYQGYDIILQTLFRDFVARTSCQENKTLNLWGIVPGQDVFWKGNLQSLKTLLGNLGYQVNTFFGEGETLANLQNAARATLNIVVSDTYGIGAAKVFAEVHGVPYISVPLPIGPTATGQFLRTVGATLEIASKFVERLIRIEEDRYYSYYERLADIYNDIDLQRYAIVLGDANYAPALARFLADDLGWLPELAVVTDILDEHDRELVRQRFQDFQSGIQPRVVFDSNASRVAGDLNEYWPRNRGQRYYDALSPAFVLGSIYDRDLAETLGAAHLSVTFPVTNRVVLDRSYAGYSGGLRLTEDILSVLVAGR